jgi:hypothetical protein
VVVFDVVSEVAWPLPFSALGGPTAVPAGDTHPPAVTSAGWQRKNVTVPVGVPPTPSDTVAVSLTEVFGATPPPVGFDSVETVDGVCTVVKHSVVAFVWFCGL